MAETGNQLVSLRPNRYQHERVMLALAISLFAHVLIFSGYVMSREVPSLRRVIWVAAHSRPVPVQQYEQPLEFVPVEATSTEAPKNTKYYSNKNSVAANPDANQNTAQPKINGKQTDIPAMHDVPDYRPAKSPTGNDLRVVDASLPQPGPKASEVAGDLTLGKPDQAQQQPPRPRTLKEAYQQMASRIPSMTMKQDGGVARHDAMPSLDVKLTGYGDYDDQMIDTIRQNWFGRIYDSKFPPHSPGTVELDFDMDSNGKISNLTVGKRTTAGYILVYACQQALLDGVPYGPWTQEMMRTLGTSRSMTFTFLYY